MNERADIYWLWLGEDYDEQITKMIRDIDSSFAGTEDDYFVEADLFDKVRELLLDVAIEVYQNQPTRGYSADHFDTWAELRLVSLALAYSIYAGLSRQIQSGLLERYTLVRSEMYGYYI